MSAVTAWVLVELRRRWRSWVGLALVAGLGGGTVVAAVAGARRTETSYRRFLAAQRASDVEIRLFPGWANAVPLEEVAHLPQVAATGRILFAPVIDPDLSVFAPADDQFGTVVDRPKLLAGRMPRADQPDEAAVSFTLARARGLHPGSALAVDLNPLQQGAEGASPPGHRVPVTLRVVGVEASPGEFPPRTGTGRHAVHLSPAFVQTEPGKSAAVGGGFSQRIRLKRGATEVGGLEGALRGLAGEAPVYVVPRARQAANVQRSIHLQAQALRLVGGLIALVTVLVLSQLLARQSYLESVDHPTLAVLGMTRGQLWAGAMARVVLAGGVAGAVVALAVAWLASPLTPLGSARVAEPDPGFALDGLAMGLGGVAIVLAVLILAALPAWRRARAASAAVQSETLGRPSILARAVGVGGLPPSAAVGMRMALEPGRGRSAVPVRTSLASFAIGVAALAGAVTFGASLTHLLVTPRLYGWSWDAYLESNAFQVRDIRPGLVDDHRLAAVATADVGFPLAVGRLEVDGFGIGPTKGLLEPVVVEGRPARAPDEVALGTKTLRALDARIGDTIGVRISVFDSPPLPRRIVGRVVLPSLEDASRFGVGAFLTRDGEATLAPPDFQWPSPSFLVRFSPGVDRTQTLADLQRQYGDAYAVVGARRPGDVENFGQVDSLPLVLAGLLAVLAAATLAHTLLTAVRRRRRDLAILKTLGFVVPQVRWAVVWQATTLVTLALVVGIPVGVAVGRWGWVLVADQLGAVAEPVTPPGPLLVLVPGAILVANLVAAVPAYLAGRTRPALLLRTE